MKKLSRLTKVSLLLAVLFTLDKVLGVLRQMIISRQFGLSAELDVFNAANNLPDMLFMLISGGALAIAFIPVLTEVLNRDGREKAWSLFSNILNIAFLLTAVLSVVVAVFAKPIIQHIIAPGFDAKQVALAVELMRLNLVATLLFSISGFFMAGLQANQHFLLPALAPVLYVVGQIFGALILSPAEGISVGPITFPGLGFGVIGLAYGVIIGALLHLLIQVPGLIKFHFRWKPGVDFKDTEARKVFALMGPRLISMLCIQLVFLGTDNLASRLAAGSVSALTYGWWIMQVPETLIGTAIATAILPTLSEFFNNQKFDELSAKIQRAARVMLSLTIPIAIISGIVLLPVIHRFLGLEMAEAERVTNVTRVFLIGIVGHSLVELFVRSFYAMQKPRYPMLGAILTLVIFLGLGILLMPRLEAVGIATANTIAYATQAVFLLVMLGKTLPSKLQLGGTFGRDLLAAAVGGLASYAVLTWLPGLLGGFLAAIVGFIVGVLVAAVFVRRELGELTQL